MTRRPEDIEAEALRLWDEAQALRTELARSQEERLRDFGVLLGVQQDLPAELRVEGGTNYYAHEIARGLELDKVALLREAGHVLPDLYGKLASVPEPVVIRGSVVQHGFPVIPEEQLPLGMQQCRVCGMIWSLLGFYSQKDRGIESLCRACKFERGKRNRARLQGRSYRCESEYAAVRAVFRPEGPEERAELGIRVKPEQPASPRAVPPTPTPFVRAHRRKPIPKLSHTTLFGARGPAQEPGPSLLPTEIAL